MATWNADGTNTFAPGESNARAVEGPPPQDVSGVEHPGAPPNHTAPPVAHAPVAPAHQPAHRSK